MIKDLQKKFHLPLLSTIFGGYFIEVDIIVALRGAWQDVRDDVLRDEVEHGGLFDEASIRGRDYVRAVWREI